MNNFRETEKFEDCQTLTLSWSISKGRDTYGYNICRLDSNTTRYRAMGGGYDMKGTVLASWLVDEFQDRLQAIGARAGAHYSKANGYKSSSDDNSLYGMARNDDTGMISIDGACGVSSVISIAEAINISISYNGNKRGQTIGFMVTVYSFNK
jgi:hypothetical protein